jgi:hypothetical protein
MVKHMVGPEAYMLLCLKMSVTCYCLNCAGVVVELVLTKLDRRHRGYGIWKYSVTWHRRVRHADGVRQFWQWREWAWNTWGPSKEVEWYSTADMFDGECSSNAHWCWQCDQWATRLFLRDDVEAELFMLRWK